MKSGILVNGRLLDIVFNDIIEAGQWAYANGYNPGEYKAVQLLPNGEINHRAIIQVYSYKKGDYILENHYTTDGKFHLPMERYEVDKERFKEEYRGDLYKVDAWIEY
ncbi:MAG: hypothetical protein M0Q88_08040 [Bacilli bacterium]|nr:hypothetical protein [Bacilli bacterium]